LVPLTSDGNVLAKPGTPRNRQSATGEKRRHVVLDRDPLPDDGAPRFVAQSTPQFVWHLQLQGGGVVVRRPLDGHAFKGNYREGKRFPLARRVHSAAPE